MKNLSRLTALLIAFAMMLNSAALAAEIQIPVSELDLNTYSQMVEAASEESGTPLYVGVINQMDVRMYQKPYNSLTFGNTLIATLAQGENVAVYEGQSGSVFAGWWYKVEYEGQTGYIETKYIDLDTAADEIRDEATGIIAQGVDEDARLVVEPLNSDALISAGISFAADISIDGRWSGDSVTLTIPVDTEESALDVIHFIEDERAISESAKVMHVSAFASLRGSLEKAIEACYAATGLEDCVAVELMENVPVENGSVSFEVSSFSVFAAGSVAATTYEFYVDGSLHARQVLIGDDSGKATLLQPKTPDKDNAEFLGWKVQGDEDTALMTFGEVEVSKTADATIKCDAVFSETYSVYFMYRTANTDANAYVMRTVSGKPGDVIDVTGVHYPASDALIVLSWHTDKEPTKDNRVESVTIGNSDITLWPNVHAGHWIMFDTQGGTVIDPISCAEGSTVTEPEPPVKAGYEFSHWVVVTDGSAGSEEFSFESVITSSIELRAVWMPAETTYTVVPVMEEPESVDGRSVYTPIAGASWTETGTTETTVTFDTIKEKLPEYIGKAEAGSEFVVNRKWFATDPAKDLTGEVTLAGDGSSVVYVYYNRRTIQYQFYEKEISNGESGTSGKRQWIEDETNNPLRYTMTGRYGEKMTYEHVIDAKTNERAFLSEDGYADFRGDGWLYLGTTGNGRNWDFNINEFTTLPSQYEYISDTGEPYYSYKVFQGESAYDPDGQTWQLFYYGQALTEDGTTIRNEGVDIANMDAISFTDADNPAGGEPAAFVTGDENWTRLATETWSDESNYQAGIVWYTPKEGFTLAAYAFDLLPEGTGDVKHSNRLEKTNGSKTVGSDTLKGEVWEVGLKQDSAQYIWTAFHEAEGTQDKTDVNQYYGSYLSLGEWKYWFAEDKDELFKDGKAVLSYMRNRGDIYIRMLRNQYKLTFVNPYYTNEDDGANVIGSTNVYYEAALDPAKQSAIADFIKASNEVQPEGMEFVGWYDNAEYTGDPVNLSSAKMPSSDLTLYAKYQKVIRNVYVYKTVDGSDEPTIFEFEYGAQVNAKREAIDALQSQVNRPVGSEWYGWYTHELIAGAEGTYIPVPFNFGQQITKDIYLYPYYGTTKPYTVTYDANGGTGTAPTDGFAYFIGSGAVILGGESIAKQNQVFLGWNTAEDGTGTTYLPGALAEISGDLALYAIWGDAVGSVMLTYHENLSADQPEKTHEVAGILENDEHRVLANMFTDDINSTDGYHGYAFTGWNTAADGTGETFLPEEIVNVTSGEDNHLYAMWERIYGDIKITKDVDGACDPDQTFVFEVLDGSGKLMTQVVIKGEGSATVRHLPLGQYCVREKDAWSWRFDKEPEGDWTVYIQTALKANETDFNWTGSKATYTVNMPEAEFINKNSKSEWLDGSHYKENAFD